MIEQCTNWKGGKLVPKLELGLDFGFYIQIVPWIISIKVGKTTEITY